MGVDKMPQDKPKSAAGTLIVVGLVAFVLGRCSAAPDAVPTPSASAITPAAETSPSPQSVLESSPPEPLASTSTEVTDTAENPWASSSTSEVADEPTDGPEPAAASEPEPEPVNTPASAEVYYQNCSAARAAGAAPINEGEPGYAPKLDRDRDGVACE